ncbi:dihydrodipicolinate reductase [Nocardia sp. NPDC050378]|uniref:NAD(P)H-dependent amine dehydrogenase family protein n=1 Tax=Nocardia sp. NPDC050378 TaxID=3155400 RepID=UPI00340B3E26
MTIKVIQWATGSVGRESVDCILDHPDLELVGCWVHSAEKTGKDVGEVLGIPATGVITTNSLDEICAIDADAVMYSPLVPNPKEVSALLRSGKNVVTPVGWFYPDDEQTRRMNEACEAAGVTLHGTGMDPGAITEVFPLIMSAMSKNVTFVRGEEISDIRGYGSPDVVRDIMMFGGTPEEAVGGPMLDLLDSGYRQSLNMITDALGIKREGIRIERLLETAVATAPIESPIGTIEPGHVAGQRFYWDAYVGHAKVARVGVTWLMGEENLEPAWDFGEQGERFDIEVRGTPDTVFAVSSWHPETNHEGLDRNLGIIATAAHCVNAIPVVVEAAPGVQTSLDLPMITGRAHKDLIAAAAQP